MLLGAGVGAAGAAELLLASVTCCLRLRVPACRRQLQADGPHGSLPRLQLTRGLPCDPSTAAAGIYGFLSSKFARLARRSGDARTPAMHNDLQDYGRQCGSEAFVSAHTQVGSDGGPGPGRAAATLASATLPECKRLRTTSHHMRINHLFYTGTVSGPWRGCQALNTPGEWRSGSCQTPTATHIYAVTAATRCRAFLAL